MERLPVLSPSQMRDEQKALYQGFIEDAGASAYQLLADNEGLRGPFNAFAQVPNIGERVRRLARELRRDDRLPDDLYEAAILSVGGVWQGGYMINIHRARGRAAGLTDELITQLTDRDRDTLDAAREIQTVWRFCRELAIEREVSDETFAAAREQLGQEALIALVITVGFYGLISGLLRAFEVSPILPGPPAEQDVRPS